MKKHISKNFNRATDSYDHVSSLQRIIGFELFEKLKSQAKNPATILDLGAGTGFFTQQLSRHYPSSLIMSLDIASEMVKKIKTSSPSSHAICADFDYLPFPSDSVDVVFANASLQWSLNLTHTLRNIYKILKPKGYLFFSTFSKGTLNELEMSWKEVNHYAHVNSFIDKNELIKLLEDIIFTRFEVQKDYYPQSFLSVFDLLNHLKLLGANQVLTQKSWGLTGKKQFKKMIAAYETYRGENGELPASYYILSGFAQK